MHRSYIIPWSRINIGKLTVAQVVKKLVDPCSLEFVTDIHSEPNKLNPYFHTFTPKIRFNIILQLRLCISSNSFPLWFSTNSLYTFPRQCPTHLPFLDIFTVIKPCSSELIRTREQVTRQLRHPRLDASPMA
jgi:hypothetical protein